MKEITEEIDSSDQILMTEQGPNQIQECFALYDKTTFLSKEEYIYLNQTTF